MNMYLFIGFNFVSRVVLQKYISVTFNLAGHHVTSFLVLCVFYIFFTVHLIMYKKAVERSITFTFFLVTVEGFLSLCYALNHFNTHFIHLSGLAFGPS